MDTTRGIKILTIYLTLLAIFIVIQEQRATIKIQQDLIILQEYELKQKDSILEGRNALVKDLLNYEPRMVKIGANEKMQEKIDYAFRISNYDTTFIYMLEVGNPKWDEYFISKTGDYGISQINKASHSKIVADPRMSDWKFQIDKGYELYKSGTRFYGLDNIRKVLNRFKLTIY